MVVKINNSFKDAYNKLHKYVCDGGQPASEFLDQIRVLDPRALIDLPFEIDNFCCIPGIESVSMEEWCLYRNHIGPNAVKQSKAGSIDLILFWQSKADLLPKLYSIASTYCTGTISSCEVERAFSAYNDVLTPHRTRANPIPTRHTRTGTHTHTRHSGLGQNADTARV